MYLKKVFLPLALALLLPSLAWAVENKAADTDNVRDTYFPANLNPKLTPEELASVKLAKQWGQTRTVRPVAGADGSVQYTFDASQPTIVTAVLQVTDVQLQPGEQVQSLNYGDTARWVIDPAITGTGPEQIQHLIIKPKDVGLSTSLVVATNRRTYHMRLISTKDSYVPLVTFSYPEGESAEKWDALKQQEAQQPHKAASAVTGEYLGNLDFGYDISGRAPWKPLRVYNDGKKTIIEFPHAIKNEAPTLLVVRSGVVFSGDQNVMVNYRMEGSRYVVDSLFDRAILITGVGSSQDKVTITRTGAKHTTASEEN